MNLKILWVTILSVIPGLAHLYLGRYKKSISLLAVSISSILTWICAKTLIIKLLMSMVFLATAVPAGIEANHLARHDHHQLYTNQRWFITMLLLVAGFSALPLLWQSDKFSKTSKIVWSIAVPALAVLFFMFLGMFWGNIESFLEHLIGVR